MNDADTQQGLLLADCDAFFQHGGASHYHKCRVFFDLRRCNPLLIEVSEPSDYSLFSSLFSAIGAAKDHLFLLKFPHTPKPIECFPISWEVSNSGLFVSLVPRFSMISIDHGSALVRVNSGVLNLGEFWFMKPAATYSFTLRHSDWLFEFVPVSEETPLYPASIQNDEFFFTHHMVLRKEGGTPFSSAEAHEELDQLSLFFAFCRGYWITTTLTSGLNEQGTVAMEEWGVRKHLPSRSPYSWLDLHHGTCMEMLFPQFIRLISDPAWKEALEHAIYWYVRSDSEAVGSDGACILLQAALEQLAWHVLVRDRQSISEEGFSKLPAADQLRLLLSAMKIPLALPTEMSDLQRIARELNWSDGPQAFVEIRNRLVHPPRKRKLKREYPYYDAYQLAKWYLELVVLSACGVRRPVFKPNEKSLLGRG